MSIVFAVLKVFIEILTISIFVRTILSWILPGQTNFFTDIVYHVTEPILAPLRKIMPRTGMMDFTPLAAIIVLQVIWYLFP